MSSLITVLIKNIQEYLPTKFFFCKFLNVEKKGIELDSSKWLHGAAKFRCRDPQYRGKYLLRYDYRLTSTDAFVYEAHPAKHSPVCFWHGIDDNLENATNTSDFTVPSIVTRPFRTDETAESA